MSRSTEQVNNAPSLGFLPIFSMLSTTNNVLIAGAGGGFDIFCGLPLFFYLQASGKNVHLANFTFSNLPEKAGRRITRECIEITAESYGYTDYFPEKHLAQWLSDNQLTRPIYCFERSSSPCALKSAYQALIHDLDIDCIILVDGGTDSLLCGDEVGLGTPVHDMTSICVVEQLKVPTKILTCLGFGIDAFHDVCHAQVLETISAIIRTGGYLGAFSLTREMSEYDKFHEATMYALERTPHRPSIVCTSILSALEGHFGDVHRTPRTRGSELFINPLMSIYWCFQLQQVAERIPYLAGMRDLSCQSHVDRHIREYRKTLSNLRPHRHIPI